MFCFKCGAENFESSQFCSECGSKLEESSFNADGTPIVNYAGFWKRVFASIIDSIILFFISGILGYISGELIGSTLSASGVEETLILIVELIVSYLIGVISSWLYHTILESSKKQATYGKMAMGIVVTDADCCRISFGRANARYWGKILSSIILCIGFLMAGFTEKKQALHDMVADTLVVNK